VSGPALTHTPGLLAELIDTRSAILERLPRARLLAFWDLDGTLLAGDCSEGSVEGVRTQFPGLVQLAIERGLSADYRGPRAHERCMGHYAWLREHVGAWMAYPFLAQVFAGADERELLDLAAEHFDSTLSRFYFPSSSRLFEGLADCGIEQHILSASAEIFVRGAAESLGVAPAQLHGIRVRTRCGLLTRDLIHPVTYAAGKLDRMHDIVLKAEAETPERPVFIIGAFGDSYDNDGPFMAHVSRTALPAGRPLAVMVNAGIVPDDYRGLFRSARHTLDGAEA